MKKIILAVSIVLLCAACGGDGSSSDPVQPNPSTEQNAAEVTNDDIVKFLNLDKQQNVYQALETAKASLGNRTVNGKALNVTAIDVLNSDEEKGTFTLRVTGNSGGKTFTKDVEYTNFAQKPNDYEMVSRAVAAWKTDVNYLKDFDFDTLYRLKDNSKFTTAYLQKFINLSSSSVGGSKHYIFTPADWANTTVSDVRYVGSSTSGQVAFTITYKGRKNSSVGVEMNKNEYYRNQISVNTEEVSKLYMRGVYEHADVFHTSLFKFDSEKFVPYLKSKRRDDGTNAITLSIQLVAKDGHDTELANFDVELTGFKPLSALDNDLTIGSSIELRDFFAKRYKSKADGDYSAAVSRLNTKLWFNKVEMYVTRDNEQIDLQANGVQSEYGGGNVTAWEPTSNLAKYFDFYLLEPRIEVTSAKKIGNFLDITYKIVYVNDVAVDGKLRTLHVHLVEA
ncbi:lipoprotein 17-related variable surface protein [Prevotella melaninogenica]|uniref:lipoprotein 17-related variable surface protein n=1 Tax=Prevotella melaninogenica TaxID=28132 RepID=UPI003C785C62